MYRTATNHKQNIFIDEFKKYIFSFRIFFFVPLFEEQKCGFLLRNLIRITKTLFCVCIVFIYCYTDPKVFENWTTMRALSRHAIFFGDSITLIACFVNADLSKDHEPKIYDLFEQIDMELQFKLLVVVDYVRQKRQIYKKLGVSITLLLSVFIGTAIIDSYANKPLLVLIAKKLQANLIFVRCLQLVFYIDLTKMRMEMVRSRLNQFMMVQTKVCSFKQTYEKMVAMKKIYGQIWEVTHHINKCFGMSLLAITTFFFLDFVCKFLLTWQGVH